MSKEAMKLALEALEYIEHNYMSLPAPAEKAITALREALAEQPAQQEPVLQDIEQYRLQMAGISTAAIGYWKEGDGIHPDYDTVALRDVAKLYAKYDELYRAQPAQQEPVAWVCHGWSSDEKHAIDYEQHEIDAIPVGTLLYTSPPAQRTWVGLTNNELQPIADEYRILFGGWVEDFARAIEAKLKERNT